MKTYDFPAMYKQAFNCSLAWNAVEVKSHMLLITFPDCTNSKEHLCFLFPMSELLRSVCAPFPGFQPKKRGNRGRIKLLVLCVGEPSCRPPASTQPQTDRRRAEAAAGLPEVWGTVLEPATAGPWKLSLFLFVTRSFSSSSSVLVFPSRAFLPRCRCPLLAPLLITSTPTPTSIPPGP